jgi:hypothetical protein
LSQVELAAQSRVTEIENEARREIERREAVFKQEMERMSASQRELQGQLAMTRDQLTMLSHQSRPETAAPDFQNGTAQSELMGCISALRAEVQQLQQSRSSRSSRAPTVTCDGTPPPGAVPIAAPCVAPFPASVPASPTPLLSPLPVYQHPPPSYHSLGAPVSSHRPHGDSPSGSSDSSEPGGGGGWGGPPGGSPLPPHGSPHRPRGDVRSAGVGSGVFLDEYDIYKNKDLSLVKIDTLPVDAGMYRGWRNAFLTKVSAIDKTGQNVILRWLSQAFDGTSQRTSLMMRRPCTVLMHTLRRCSWMQSICAVRLDFSSSHTPRHASRHYMLQRVVCCLDCWPKGSS